jgi:antitoxin CptB
MTPEHRLKRLRFRAWHRGTKEADLLIGGYFDRYHAGWDTGQVELFEALLAEEDVDIMAWAIGTQAVPDRYAGLMMDLMKRLDFIPVAR